MKTIFLLPVIVFFGMFVQLSCTNTSNQTFRLEELVDRAVADKDNWQGQEVTVSGYVSHMPSRDSKHGYVVYLSSQHDSDAGQWQLTCKVPQGDVPEGIISQTIEVKGRIGLVNRQSYLNMKSVTLDPWEIKKWSITKS